MLEFPYLLLCISKSTRLQRESERGKGYNSVTPSEMATAAFLPLPIFSVSCDSVAAEHWHFSATQLSSVCLKCLNFSRETAEVAAAVCLLAGPGALFPRGSFSSAFSSAVAFFLPGIQLDRQAGIGSAAGTH